MVPGAEAEARVDALLAAHGLAPRALRAGASGLALALQGWPSRARWQRSLLDLVAATGCRSCSPARPTSASAPSSRRSSPRLPDGVRAAVHDLTGTLSLRELAALTARARALRRRRLGADAHRRGDGHAGRSRCSAPPSEREWGPWQVAASRRRVRRLSLPPVRQRRLRRRQGVRVPHDAAGRPRARRASTTLLARTATAALA